MPFCVKKCNYCAFLSFNADESPRKEYSEALIHEIETVGGRMRDAEGRLRHIDTIYIGGGTPSVMDVSQLSLIMKAVRRSFDIDPDAEITLEANPGTIGRTDRVTRTKLIAYKYMGVNRLSFGVQSMDNYRLDYLGRIHTMEDVVRDMRYAREAGFDNISLDLIFSVPGETTEDALSDARRILELEPQHISCYSLQLEEGTPFYSMAEAGELEEVSDEDDRRTYHELVRLLSDAGYEHYEISNWALRDQKAAPDAPSPFRSRHNSSYWDMSEYIGLGLGASGFAGGTRYRNTADLDTYLSIYGSGIDLPKYDEWHVNTPFDNASEAVFTGLRRREGISYHDAVLAYDAGAGNDGAVLTDRERFWEIFSEAKDEALKYAEDGYLIIDEEGLRLTESGIDISNGIMSLFV